MRKWVELRLINVRGKTRLGLCPDNGIFFWALSELDFPVPEPAERCPYRGTIVLTKPYAYASCIIESINFYFIMKTIELLLRRSPALSRQMRASSTYIPKDWLDIASTTSRGLDVLHDARFSKWGGHQLVERERLGLRGLLPPEVLTMDQQASRILDHFWNGTNFLSHDEVADGGISLEDTRKWQVMQAQRERNLTLYFRILVDNFVDMAHVIYTPTVGWACANFHKLNKHPLGMYFSAADQGEMATMVWNWPSDSIDAIVVTDGSRILGLGDLGINGMGIPVGKLDLYVAAAGFHPSRVLPCVIDVGTDNEALRNDPWYQGLKQPRVTGQKYIDIMDEFVSAVMGRWPSAVLQFEDFQNTWAATLLKRYQDFHTVFNDDIQGTAAVAVSGLLGAQKVLGRPLEAVTEQRIVVSGAGSAGMGVVNMIVKLMMSYGLSAEQARERFHILDIDGLVTSKRNNLAPEVELFARKEKDAEDGEDLLMTVKRVKPTCLIGLSGAGRLYTKEVLTVMGQVNERPIIMPMSNPTIRMECTHQEAQDACDGRAIFASGSPQPDVVVNGKSCLANQANNMYVFPGLAMAAFLSKGNKVTDGMIMAAAETVPKLLTDQEVAQGKVYPSLKRIREISAGVVAAVIAAADNENVLLNINAKTALIEGTLENYIKQHMYEPTYASLVHVPSKHY